MKHGVVCLLWLGAALPAAAQKTFIRLAQPSGTAQRVEQARQYISGSTCPTCRLSVNGAPVKVWPTGAFALQLDLSPGDTAFVLQATGPDGSRALKRLTYHYSLPVPVPPVRAFRIAEVTTDPASHSWLMPGDRVLFRVRAQPGNEVSVGGLHLYEQPADGAGTAGIYQGSRLVQPGDAFLQKPMTVLMRNAKGEQQTYTLSPGFRVLDPDEPIIGRTVGSYPYLDFGLGEDRLGGAKIGYLDTAVALLVTGRRGGDYRVQLAPGRSAYIPMGQLSLLPKGAFPPRSLSGSFRIWGEKRYDYVSIALEERLPYTSFQLTDPSRIVVDIYGAVSNTNWVTQLSSAKEVQAVDYEQLSDSQLRVTVTLRHHQAWGYRLWYEGHKLVLQVRQQPPSLTLSRLTIAVDAGHGGSNRGARGPTGVYEKTLTLQIAKRLAALLRQAGATVVMTREGDDSKDMIQRRTFLHMADPDLLVSIHLNASGDPVHVSGTSTYYRYIGFRPLSQAILRRMLALGLAEYGNVGRFNFSLNGPTAYPNALVETLFLSHPEDEMKALDPDFQQRIAGAVVQGINDFLKEAAGPAPAP